MSGDRDEIERWRRIANSAFYLGVGVGIALSALAVFVGFASAVIA